MEMNWNLLYFSSYFDENEKKSLLCNRMKNLWNIGGDVRKWWSKIMVGKYFFLFIQFSFIIRFTGMMVCFSWRIFNGENFEWQGGKAFLVMRIWKGVHFYHFYIGLKFEVMLKPYFLNCLQHAVSFLSCHFKNHFKFQSDFKKIFNVFPPD
jgi:hypothetical protein